MPFAGCYRKADGPAQSDAHGKAGQKGDDIPGDGDGRHTIVTHGVADEQTVGKIVQRHPQSAKQRRPQRREIFFLQFTLHTVLRQLCNYHTIRAQIIQYIHSAFRLVKIAVCSYLVFRQFNS